MAFVYGDYLFAMAQNMLAREMLQTRSIQADMEQTSVPDASVSGSAAPEEGLDDIPDLCKQLSPYFNHSRFSDMTLRVQKHTFQVHKLILAAWSEAFRDMINRSQRKRKRKTSSEEQSLVPDDVPDPCTTITLTESKECAEVFEVFLKFMYTEEVELSRENVYPIFRLAKKYKVKDLIDVCQEYLIEEIANDGEEAVQIVHKAEHLGMTNVHKRCIAVLESNFEFLSESCLLDMDPGLFLKLLGSSKLVVGSELVVVLRAFTWLMAKGKEDNRKHTEEVISLIRFAHLSPSELKTLGCVHLMCPVYPRLKNLLQKQLPGALEWKALAPDDAFNDLPYYVQFASFARNFVKLRYYVFELDKGYGELKLQTKADEVSYSSHYHESRTSEAHDVFVAQVSANNVCKWVKASFGLTGIAFRNPHPASKKWGIRYNLATSRSQREAHAKRVYYRLVVLTRTQIRGKDQHIMCTSAGTILHKHIITATLLPKFTRFETKPSSVDVKIVLFIWVDESDMPKVKLLTVDECLKRNAVQFQKCKGQSQTQTTSKENLICSSLLMP